MSSRILLRAGIAGPLLFTAVTLAEGLTRPNYDPARHLVSELALTSRGWIQIANFVLTGALLIAFAVGLRTTIRDGPASTWGPRWVGLAGAALIGAGAFVIDPGPSYPPAAPTTSWHGALHDVFGPLVFLSLAMSALVHARRIARPYGITAGVLVLVLFAATSALVTLGYAGVWESPPAGLPESLSLYTGLAWNLVLAVHLLRRSEAGGGRVSPPGSRSPVRS